MCSKVPRRRQRKWVSLFAIGALAAILLLLIASAKVHAQAATAPAASRSKVPDWQTAAGGKMEFDVASVKQNQAPAGPQTVSSNFPLGPGNMYTPNGGLFRATDYPLFLYVSFAYKMNTYQMSTVMATLPKWVTTDRYDIEAHASGNPTKDQMRLMMQVLLADRFKLQIHAETRQVPIFALVLDKPGKTGPQLAPYPDGTPCDPSAPTSSSSPAGANMVGGMFPVICGGYAGMPPTAPGRIHLGARNVTIQIMADQFPGLLNSIDRPVYDRTGLAGTFDFALEFEPDRQVDANPADNPGPTFLEALKEQLGLKLDSETDPADVYVIDHIEEPSQN